MLVVFAVDCVVSRIVGCFIFYFFYFLNLGLDDLLFCPGIK